MAKIDIIRQNITYLVIWATIKEYVMLQDAIGRPVGLASYMLEKKCTIRECAKHFGISKSTVHLDVSVRLRKINKDLYSQVKELLEYHREVRHLRGGMATKEKYKSKKLYQKLPC